MEFTINKIEYSDCNYIIINLKENWKLKNDLKKKANNLQLQEAEKQFSFIVMMQLHRLPTKKYECVTQDG